MLRLPKIFLESLLVVVIFFNSPVFARTYYVATTGVDANNVLGDQAYPFKTIQKAADAAQPGDNVIIGPGLYYERVVIRTSGTAAQPIIFEGTRDANGEWLTIMGPQVYQATFPYEVYAMTVDGPNCSPSNPNDCSKNIWRIGSDAMNQRGTFAYGGSDYQGGGPIALSRPADQLVNSYPSGQKMLVKYWDGIGALFGYYNGKTFLRFRNGEDPNTKNIHVSPGPVNQFTRPTTGAAIKLDGAKYITFRDCRIRGARSGVLLENFSMYNIIENNHITNGQSRVRIGTNSAYNEIRNNVLHANQVSGWLPGARSDSSDPAFYDRVVNWNLYLVNKFTIGDGGTDDRAVFLWQSGLDNRVHHNEIYESGIGVALLDKADNTKIYNNSIHNTYAEGLYTNNGIIKAEIFDNLLYDSGINFRLMELDYNNIEIYIRPMDAMHFLVETPQGSPAMFSQP